MNKKFIKDDIDLEAALIIAKLIKKEYATPEAQERSENFTPEQVNMILEAVSKR